MALAAVCLSALMFGLEISSVPAILPTLEQVLHADFRQLQWIMNAYALMLGALVLAGGAAADRYGRRRVFVVGVVLFSAASALCGAAPDLTLLIMARALQGVGAALLVPASLALLGASFASTPY